MRYLRRDAGARTHGIGEAENLLFCKLGCSAVVALVRLMQVRFRGLGECGQRLTLDWRSFTAVCGLRWSPTSCAR